MRSYARGVLFTLGALCLAGSAAAQDYGSPSLLPIAPLAPDYTTSRIGYDDDAVAEATPPAVNPSQDELPSPSDVGPSPEYQEALNQSWGDGACTTCGDGYGSHCRKGYWFGSVGGLILGTPTRHSTYLSYDSTTYSPVMQTGDVNTQFSGGVDFTVGRMFGCGNWGTAFTYWGIYPSAQQADIYDYNVSGNLGSYLPFGNLNYNGNPATMYWNDVVHQRIVTNQEIHSVEWNLLGNCCGGGLWNCAPWDGCRCGGSCGPRLAAGWMAGVRYFQFNDDFRFYSDNADNQFTGNPNEIQYLNQTRNNLLGFQVGGGLNYRVWNCFSLYGIGKAGIYGNRMIVDQAVYGAAGDAVVNTGYYNGQNFRMRADETNLAFIGQLDMGGRYQLGRCWTVEGGYRMVGLNGLALTNSQIPSNFAYIPDAQRVHSGDCVILHGAYIGATFCF